MRAHGDIVFGLVVTLVAALMMTVVIPVGIDSPGEVDILALSPSFWPLVIMALMGSIGLVVTLRALLALRAAKEPDAAGPLPDNASTAGATASGGGSNARVVACVAILFAFQQLLEPLGLVLASTLVITALMLLAGERRARLIVPIALLVPAGLYLFFTHVAMVQIPLGVLEPLTR